MNRKFLPQLIAAVAVVGVLTLLVVFFGTKKPSTSQANPTNMLSNGIVLTQDLDVVSTPAIPDGGKATFTVTDAGKTKIDIYLDYLCPFCKQFESSQEAVIKKYIESGEVQVEFHPIALLSEYSAVAANASACVAGFDSKKWWNVNYILYTNQPDENAARKWSKQESIDYVYNAVKNSGLNSESLQCVKTVPYYDWSINATEQAVTGPLPYSDVSKIDHTPTVIIDGVNWSEDFVTNPDVLDSFIAQKMAEKNK